jgi:hypothetical protein
VLKYDGVSLESTFSLAVSRLVGSDRVRKDSVSYAKAANTFTYFYDFPCEVRSEYEWVFNPGEDNIS